MKLGIINGWSEGCFKYVHDKGLDAIEFCANDRYDSREILSQAQQIKGYSEKYNVAVGSIGRWGMERIDAEGEIIPEALQHDKNLIDLASIVGCPVFNVGCNFIETKSYYENCMCAVKYFGTLIDYARDKNVKIAVYNCAWSNFVYEEKAWSVILGALPELGIKYDVSHCLSRCGDYLKEMMDWGERIYHVHIKGSLSIGGDHYDDAPAGLDGVKWGAVMDVLYTKGYNGMLSIEPHSDKWKGGMGQWGIDFTINFMRKFIMPDEYRTMETSVYMP